MEAVSTLETAAEGRDIESKMYIENLSMYYGEFKAIEDITLDVPPRRITSLIGPSGCGKSTLVRCLNRMNDLIEGVRVEGWVASQRRCN